MMFSKFSVAVFLLLSVTTTVLSGEDSSLSDFGQKALDYLPKSAFEKLFTLRFKTYEEVTQAFKEGTKAFAKVLGQPTPANLSKGFENAGRKLADKLKPKILFRAYTNAISRTLSANGDLTSEYANQLAKRYAELLEKAAKSLKSTDVGATIPAISATNAKFFKSLDMTSEQLLIQFENNLLLESSKIK